MLLYAGSIGDLVRRVVPTGSGAAEDDFPRLLQRAVSSYLRGQLLFSLVMGASVAAGLWIFGVAGIFPDGRRYALFFGVFYGLMELVPYVGPVLGAIPAVLVALFNDPISALWVALLFLALQQLEGHVVAPQIFSHSLRINPLLIIFALLIGDQLYGIVGALVALPIAALLKETVLYLRRHLVLEPWNVAAPAGLAPGGASLAGLELLPVAVARAHCPDCGAPAAHDDAFCRSCGAPLAPRVRAPG
jgi:predicted PurR-regulated permease PerM